MHRTMRFILGIFLVGWALGLTSWPGEPARFGPPAALWAAEEKAGTHQQAEAVTGAHDAHSKEPGMFDINLGILASQTVNFFILLFLLKKFLYGPIQTVLEERKTRVRKTLEDADQEKARALALKNEYESKLSKMEKELYQMKQKAISEAQTAKDDIVAAGKKTSDNLLEKAHKDILLERRKAWVELREDAVKLALLGAEKVIDKVLDEPAHHELIRKAIMELEKER